MRRKKKFECGHTAFGKRCYKCQPLPRRSPKAQLDYLDSKGFVAAKERIKIQKKLAKAK